MGKINVNPGEVERVADGLKKISGEIGETSTVVAQISSEVEQGWQSQYTQTYLDELEVVRNNIGKISDRLTQNAQVLRNYAEQVREIERRNQMEFLE